LGGLTVLRGVRARLPTEDIVFLADQAHVPYGDRSTDELRGYLHENVAFLDEQGVEAIVMGCNTSCAIAARFGMPPARAAVLDLIEAAAGGVAASGARRVGVVATTATTRSGAYGAAIRRRDPGIAVQEIAAPALVPLVEAGTLEGPVARDAVAAACAQFDGPLDAVVLACTHFPFLDEHFAAVLGASVVRLDPAVAQSERAVAFALERGPNGETGRTSYLTTGPLEPFRLAIERLRGPLGASDSIGIATPARVERSPNVAGRV
jgi:glutamate racemase